MGAKYDEQEYIRQEIKVIMDFVKDNPELTEAEAVDLWVRNNARSYRERADRGIADMEID